MPSRSRHARQLAELLLAVRRASRAHHASPLAVLRVARRARRDGGYEYREALACGLLDPAAGAHLDRHASKHAALEAQRRVNPEALSALTEEKAIFYRYLEAVGVPTPRLLGIVGRGTGWTPDERVITDAAAFAAWMPALPAEFVAKPSAGCHGAGVRVVVRDGSELEVAGRGRVSPEALHAELTGDPEYPLWVFQERVRNAAALDFLGAAEAVQTARICTLVHADGTVEVVHASLRLAAPGALIDNYAGGLTGNSFTLIDGHGRLGAVWSRRPDGAGFVRTAEQPGTGRLVQGRAIPGWAGAQAMVREAALLLLPARTIGWDVAFTDDGPTVIEANMWWDPPPTPDVGEAVARVWGQTPSGGGQPPRPTGTGRRRLASTGGVTRSRRPR